MHLEKRDLLKIVSLLNMYLKEHNAKDLEDLRDRIIERLWNYGTEETSSN